jgi:V/A-type H+-transporting ATPase subunit I
MIVKMHKYSLLVYHQELSRFLEKIQELGMVDITRDVKPLDSHSKELGDLRKRYNIVLKALEKYSENNRDSGEQELTAPCESECDNLLASVEEALERIQALEAELQQNERDLIDFKAWGDYNREDLEKIKTLGFDLHFYSVSENKFNEEWFAERIGYILNRADGRCYFVILSPSGEDYGFSIPESKFPHTPLHILEEKNRRIKSESDSLKDKLTKSVSLKNAFRKRALTLGYELDRYLAATSSPTGVEGKISVMTGFAPVEFSGKVENFLEEAGIYYVKENASGSDNPPVKLKNNFFARLFEPIGDLYMLPKYGELDLTPFFAPFYMLFFGFCLGDMGYGLTLLVLGGLAKFKLPKMKSYLTLLQFMGAGAIIMASFSGVFYGSKLYELFSLPDSVDSFFFSDIKMFWLAIIFGLIHIIFARLVAAIYAMITRGIQYGLGNIGWILIIIWASFSYAKTMVTDLTLPPYFNYVAIAGAALILFFSATEGNLIIRLFKGTASFYDITGIFGDMLSYIRLFGLGTSGGILGMVVNSVAINMLGIPYVGWIFTGIMLIVGHLAVLLLSSLGAFVHPMRLTFVEFYKNAGFTGGGKAYRPLAKSEEFDK